MNTTPKITAERYQKRYNKQLKKERTQIIVKRLMTAIALIVALLAIICLFLMTKAEQ